MREIKNTKQATVHITYDGRVRKRYHGPCAEARFANEVRALRYLERHGCGFVPKLLDVDEPTLTIITTNCGKMAGKLSEEKLKNLFAELEQFGVRHEDAFLRNVTYDARQGRFCLIDFEFSTILSTGEGLTLAEVEATHDGDWERKV
jgi:hypothetical protein|tara:strand:- start:3348 stop:3788 length:441 start_codon:yes stop_codon:yes gene_type:complete